MSPLSSADPQSTASSRRGFALFDYGFRPFFLLTGLFALLAVPLWLWVYTQGATPLTALPPQLWHGHEMVFGFVVAAVAGFLLTAVPSWTGARGFAGPPLVVLVSLWLAGRIAFAAGSVLPVWVVGLADLMFLPVLIALLAPPLLRGGNRNTPLLLVLAVLWLIDAAFLAAVSSGDAALGQRTLRMAIDLVLILVTVIGGRIVPSFTANALRRRGEAVQIVTRAWLDKLVILLMVAIAIIDAISPESFLSGAVAALAAAAHALRLAGWKGASIRGESILWVLHVAYAWLPIGLALKAIALLASPPWAAHWLHALTIGVFGTMILAVTTRASLGHTGRPLSVGPAIAWAYGLLTAAAIARVFGGTVMDYQMSVLTAGVLWSTAFLIYVAVYAPILTLARAEGKPG